MQRFSGFNIILLQNNVIKVCLSFVVLFYSCSCAIHPGCEKCGCCVGNVCSTKVIQGITVREYCTDGCITGIGGNKCYSKCPDDCVTCEQTDYKKCTTCDEGKYVNEEGRCVNCPKNCKQCTSATQCQECHFPYSNDISKQDCSLTCPGNCVCENLGVCSSCQDGFYNVSNTCQDVCLGNCKTCTDQSHCQSCKPSYTGDMCCVKNGHCLKCSSSTQCETCSDGYYGDQCGKECPTKCKSSHCNRENGNCISCQDGYHGTKCGMSCPKTCHRLQCDINTGNCLSCQDGYHGTKCGMSCPKTCHRLQCDINTGICLSCDVGLYGNSCSLNCSKRCLNNRCNQGNGHCSDGCVAGYKGPNCTEVSVSEDTTSCPTVTGIGTVIGIAATIVVIVVTIVIAVTIIIVRRWKTDFQRKYRGPIHEASYVNTEFQTTSIEAIDVSVNKDQIDQSQYERLDERNNKQRDEYDQITSVNQ